MLDDDFRREYESQQDGRSFEEDGGVVRNITEDTEEPNQDSYEPPFPDGF